MELTRKQLENPLSIKLPRNKIYEELVKGKGVCVVGGSQDTIDNIFLDQADLIVGINSNWLHNDYPVDILYCVIDRKYSYRDLIADERAKKISFMWIWAMSDESYDLASWCRQEGIPFNYYGLPGSYMDEDIWPESQWFRVLGKCLQTLPFTGVAAVYHLLLHDVKELMVTGMNFYKKGESLLLAKHVHDSLPQVRFLARALVKDSRLVVDEALKETIQAYQSNAHKFSPKEVELYYKSMIINRNDDKAPEQPSNS